MGDRSLDEFLDTGDEADSETDADAGAEAEPAESEADSATDSAESPADFAESTTGTAESPAEESADQESPDEESPDRGSNAPDSTPTPKAGEGVDPATSTYVRTPAGGECADCGATVERRWNGDGGLVCPDCKDW